MSTDRTPVTRSRTDQVPTTWDRTGVTDDDKRIIKALDSFLDDLAQGHRQKMEEVVEWLTGTGRLEDEINASVQSLSVLFSKWAIEICFLLCMNGTLRFNEIKGWLDGMGARTLSQRLKDLEAQGIVHREVYPEVPVRVEYSLTPRGLRMADLFLPVIAHLRLTAPRPEVDEDGATPTTPASSRDLATSDAASAGFE